MSSANQIQILTYPHIPDVSHNHYLRNCIFPHWLRCVDNLYILLNSHKPFMYLLYELSRLYCSNIFKIQPNLTYFRKKWSFWWSTQMERNPGRNQWISMSLQIHCRISERCVVFFTFSLFDRNILLDDQSLAEMHAFHLKCAHLNSKCAKQLISTKICWYLGNWWLEAIRETWHACISHISMKCVIERPLTRMVILWLDFWWLLFGGATEPQDLACVF